MDNFEENGIDWAANAWSDAVLALIKSEPFPSGEGELSPAHRSFREVLSPSGNIGLAWDEAAPVPFDFVARAIAYLLDGKELTVEDCGNPQVIDQVVASCANSYRATHSNDFAVICAKQIVLNIPEPNELDWSKWIESPVLESFLQNPNLSAETLDAVWSERRPISVAQADNFRPLYDLISIHSNTSPETLAEIYRQEADALKSLTIGELSLPGVTEKDMPLADRRRREAHRHSLAYVIANPSFPRGLYEEDSWWMLHQSEVRENSFIESTSCLVLPWYVTEQELEDIWGLVAGDIEKNPLTYENLNSVLGYPERYSFYRIPVLRGLYEEEKRKTEDVPAPPISEEEVQAWANRTSSSNNIPSWAFADPEASYSEATWIAVFNRMNHPRKNSEALMNRLILASICENNTAPNWFKMNLGTGTYFKGYETGWIFCWGGLEAYCRELGLEDVPPEWVATMMSPGEIQ